MYVCVNWQLISNPQPRRDLHQEVHPSHLPRGRPQQGRVRLPRPLRRQVLRSQREGLGKDAGRGCRWRKGRWWIWNVKSLSKEFGNDTLAGYDQRLGRHASRVGGHCIVNLVCAYRAPVLLGQSVADGLCRCWTDRACISAQDIPFEHTIATRAAHCVRCAGKYLIPEMNKITSLHIT